jgi:dolichol-phosphate mannosyltransferase
MTRPVLSLVIPVLNEEAVIPELERRLVEFLAVVGVTWEVVFVDDGSTDRSRELLRTLAERDPRFGLVALSRNFGHQLAITAGLDHAHGEAVVVMDADLQDPPEVVGEMLARYREGFDVVYGVRRRRHDETWFKRTTAAAFYRLLRAMVGVPIQLDAGDFRLMSRRVVVALRSLSEAHRFVRGMVAWVGFRQTAVLYDRPGRFAGETHYPLRRMIRFAVDGMTSFSAFPLRIATYLGILAGALGIGTAAWVVVAKLSGAYAVPGWATIMVAVCLAASAQLLMTGILGEYVGRIYEEVKRRPLYLVAEAVNAARDDDGVAAPRPSDVRPPATRGASNPAPRRSRGSSQGQSRIASSSNSQCFTARRVSGFSGLCSNTTTRPPGRSARRTFRKSAGRSAGGTW